MGSQRVAKLLPEVVDELRAGLSALLAVPWLLFSIPRNLECKLDSGWRPRLAHSQFAAAFAAGIPPERRMYSAPVDATASSLPTFF